ncbi:hypothetical protein V8D89_008419 [Ganoderma adspersum]
MTRSQLGAYEYIDSVLWLKTEELSSPMLLLHPSTTHTMPRPRPSQLIVDSFPESQEPLIVESPGDFSQVSSGSIDQRMQTQQSLDEDASSCINNHADTRFGAKMRRYGSAPGALVVFETVMRLVKYKRRNDAMADALIVDMVETIKSLTVLKYLPTSDAGEGVSRTKLDRVVELVNAIHEAVKACGNACDTYYRLKGFGCLLQSSKWLDEFEAYRNRLMSLREHLHLALTMHFGLESLTTQYNPQLQESTRLLKELCEKYVSALPLRPS